MKITKALLGILVLIIIATGCKKDDDNGFEEIAEIIVPINEAPAPVTLSAPENNTELIALAPKLIWIASTDPEGKDITYDIYLGTDESSLSIISENNSNTELQLQTDLEKDTSYFWKVLAKDTEGKASESQLFSFSTEYVKISLVTDNAPFSKRKFSSTTVFNNKIWVIGGEDESGNVLDDIWSSVDGLNWTLEVANAPFGTRRNHYTIVFQNKMWVYNGSDGQYLNADIWSSIDGVNWIKETNDRTWDNLPFYGQSSTTMFVYNDMIWRLAAYDGSIGDLTTERYIWNSSDGKNWNLVSENHGFDSKYGMAVVPFQGKLIGLEGNNLATNTFTKIWESNDGITWTLIDENLPFKLGFYTDAVVNENRLYITGGSGFNELWFTDDGINWEKATNDRKFSIRWAKASIVLNDNIYIIGGGFNSNFYNDVWELE